MLRRRTFLASSLVMAAASLAGSARGAQPAAAPAPFKLFDAHVHFHSADLARYPFRADMPEALKAHTLAHPAELQEIIRMWDAVDIEMGCAVQTDYAYHTDNRYVLAIAECSDRVSPVVILDPTDLATPAAIESMVNAYGISGVRFAGDPDADGTYPFLTADSARESWETVNDLQLAVPLLITPAGHGKPSAGAMEQVGLLAGRYPKVRIVLDHIGFPAAENTPTFGFTPEHLALAAHDNIYYKYTTLVIAQLMTRGVPAKDFLTYAISVFGADHFMWGSSMGANLIQLAGRYPAGAVLADPTRYGDVVQLGLASADGLTLKQRKMIFRETAKTLFIPGGPASVGH